MSSGGRKGMKKNAAVHGDVLAARLERLPPPGIEQVFEADEDADYDSGAHRRPRPKLSHAERIAAAKARRAAARRYYIVWSGTVDFCVRPGNGSDRRWFGRAELEAVGESWGDVVQELKDVIWKVGEQRRLREEKQQVTSAEAPKLRWSL